MATTRLKELVRDSPLVRLWVALTAADVVLLALHATHSRYCRPGSQL